MRILVVNSGGSSVKYQLVEMPQENVLARGSVERIGKDDAQLQMDVAGSSYSADLASS